jgi:hypothetical protein
MKCSVSDLWSPQLQHSLIGIRSEKLRQPRSIVAENRVPLCQSQPVWFRSRTERSQGSSQLKFEENIIENLNIYIILREWIQQMVANN